MNDTGAYDNPVPTAPDILLCGCFWFTDPDGTLCLVPSSTARR